MKHRTLLHQCQKILSDYKVGNFWFYSFAIIGTQFSYDLGAILIVLTSGTHAHAFKIWQYPDSA